jgi:hypothetical protein
MQVDDSKVINFLLKNEIVPLCLRCMEMGSELSKTVRTAFQSSPAMSACIFSVLNSNKGASVFNVSEDFVKHYTTNSSHFGWVRV